MERPDGTHEKKKRIEDHFGNLQQSKRELISNFTHISSKCVLCMKCCEFMALEDGQDEFWSPTQQEDHNDGEKHSDHLQKLNRCQ